MSFLDEQTTAMHVCLCRICLRDRQIAMVRNYGNDAAKRQLIDDLNSDLSHAEHDNDYWRAIRSGSWPGARQIAESISPRMPKLPPRTR